MLSSAEAVKGARIRAGLSQRELARRLNTTQSAIARLESTRSNPTVATLERVLDATGHRLMLASARKESGIDESLIQAQLKLSPAERLARFEAFNADVRRLMLAGERTRGKSA